MRKWELIKQSQLLKIKSQILSNLFNEKYGLRLGEFKNTTGTERVNKVAGTGKIEWIGSVLNMQVYLLHTDLLYLHDPFDLQVMLKLYNGNND